jgi:four helix bundle protein
MTPHELRGRIQCFADDVIRLCRAAPHDPLTLQVLVQLQDAATSTCANYRAACLAQSRAAFVAKLSIAVEESDEAVGWLTHLSAQGIGSTGTVNALLAEATEISKILCASRRTAQGKGGQGRRR